MICPMCLTKGSYMQPVQGPDKREYSMCHMCKLIFTPTRFQLSAAEQKKRYSIHKNGIQYPGYVKFLHRAIEPALPYLHSGMKGLDFGCGPVPTLSSILDLHNIPCDDYDPLFFPSELQPGYDFIFATECFEHFFFPAKEIKRLFNLLNEGGYMVIMTEQWKSPDQFKTWHYAKDKTHVTFYHSSTIDYICTKGGFLRLPCEDDRVFILKKNDQRKEVNRSVERISVSV